ncbi:MAG TPA: aspartate/glutamate racemase family protein [Acetobacteraceae bacterium]|nr:aspartate/glutamate racemase family protein [Acetobacteraceae bacterium]
MIRIVLINPNTSAATTAMMVGIAQAAAPPGVGIIGATARRGVPMILEAAELAAAAAEVVEIGLRHADSADGIVIGAFGDPGLVALRRRTTVPVAGLCEAAMREAAAGGRRFGVATVTPGLAGPIAARARDLGLAHLYAGIRLTPEPPAALAADPPALEAALAAAVELCIRRDGAAAVVIGGGPLGAAARALAERWEVPVIAPVPAALRALLRAFAAGGA